MGPDSHIAYNVWTNGSAFLEYILKAVKDERTIS